MSPDFLDRFSRLNSPVHRLPAGAKMLAALGLILAIVLIPIGHWRPMVAAAVILVAVALLSRIPPRFILRRLVLLEPLVLGVAVLTLFKRDGGITFLSILIKSTLCLLTMILLSNTTPFSRMIGVLRTIRTPGLLVTTLALMYRYIFVLLDESRRMRRARLSRTFTHGRWRTWRSLGTVVGQLFIRSSERAERIYSAMVARGWR